MRLAPIVLIIAAGCGSSDREELATLSFEAPEQWTREDSHSHGSATAVFAPTDNARKETVTIIRTEIGPIATRYTGATLAQLLAGAQSALPSVRSSGITRVTTDSGLEGLQIVLDYVPSGGTTTYRRIHAVLADGTALVHVLYTAASPDPDLGAFRQVLATLREES